MLQEKPLPKHSLPHSQIKNIQVIVNRLALLAFLPKNAVIAEIGVAQGDFTAQVLNTCQPKKYFLIDTWSTQRYSEEMKESVKKRFNSQIQQGQVIIREGNSVLMAQDFPDCFFDWIYLDTDHSYCTTKKELEIYRHKIKKGGIIAGHDFIQGNWLKGKRYGVIEAVSEFCIQHNWEMIYLTMDYNEFPSFGIRAIE
ncbi:MAG: class I SAM-dependent methyltransferase [Chitinophagales bacterium]|nr:class I SAM-dependent methyltransferase [Chitinophagales bacterium]